MNTYIVFLECMGTLNVPICVCFSEDIAKSVCELMLFNITDGYFYIKWCWE